MKSLYMRDRKLYNKLQRQCDEYNKKTFYLGGIGCAWDRGYAMIHPTEDKVVIFDTTKDGKISLKTLK